MQISSFDVFDTVLTRVVGDPCAIFLLLGKELVSQCLIDCTSETFATARIRADVRASGNIGEKYSLLDIYSELAISLQLTKDIKEEIMSLELSLESKLIRPIASTKRYIQTARDKGNCIVFLSDMYLPTAFVQEQLIRYEFFHQDDEIYVSNEHGKSKATGELFRDLISRKSILPRHIFHLGNNFDIDVQEAKKLGIETLHFQEGNLNRYEQILESHSRATEGLTSAMAGASRLVRLQVPVSSKCEQALRDIAAGVVAPTLVGYVLWIILQAKKMSLKRLYFISRDGQILLEIARRLAKRLDIDCELRYIYGSRLSWNLPALASLDEDQAFEMLKRPSWMLDTTSPLSLRDFWMRINIDPEEIEDCLASIGFHKEDWERMLGPNEQQALHPLLDTRKVKDLILQKAVQQQQVLINYLKQEDLLDTVPKGLIDLGWFGSSYDFLYPILKSRDATLDTGLFFGIRSHSQESLCDSKKGFFFDERTCTGFKSYLPELIVPLEMFCAADHGTVIGFVEQNGYAQPVLREERNQRVIDWGLPLVRDSIYSFTENLLLDASLINPYTDMRQACAEVLKSFWLSPSEIEATAWGDFPWEKGHSENTDSLAKSYSWLQVAKSYLTLKLASNQSIWTEGAIARSSPQVRSAIHFFFFIIAFFRSLRRRLTIKKYS
jgi:FMN phosphatase YigB (HAD superfamily)